MAAEFAGLIAVSLSGHPAMQVAWSGLEAAVLFDCGPWDRAATDLLVEEAGARFSDLAGCCSIDSGNRLFTNGRIHDELRERF